MAAEFYVIVGEKEEKYYLHKKATLGLWSFFLYASRREIP
jgi:hypothetical protein